MKVDDAPARKLLDVDAVFHLILPQSVKRARDMYKRDCGLSHNDKEIDEEIIRRFVNRDGDRGVVELPEQLVLAIMLREGFGRKQRKRKTPRWIERTKPFKIEDARELEAELVATGRCARWLAQKAFDKAKARDIERLLTGGKLTSAGARDLTCKIMAKCSKFTPEQFRRWLRKPRQQAASSSAG